MLAISDEPIMNLYGLCFFKLVVYFFFERAARPLLVFSVASFVGERVNIMTNCIIDLMSLGAGRESMWELKKPGRGKKTHSVLKSLSPWPMCISNPS